MRKRKPLERINRMLNRVDMPPVAAGTASRISIEGGCEVLVEGCDAVLEYDCEKIVLQLRDGVLALCGRELDLSGYGEQNLTVSGKICVLTLTEE